MKSFIPIYGVRCLVSGRMARLMKFTGFIRLVDWVRRRATGKSIDGFNRIGWIAYLEGVREGREKLSAYEAPARANSYEGLSPTITYVGDNDPFYW